MIAVPIDTSGQPRPYCYELNDLPCQSVHLSQISASTESDLQIDLALLYQIGDGQVRELVAFGKKLSPTSYALDHTISDCATVCLEITPRTDADVRFILMYERL